MRSSACRVDTQQSVTFYPLFTANSYAQPPASRKYQRPLQPSIFDDYTGPTVALHIVGKSVLRGVRHVDPSRTHCTRPRDLAPLANASSVTRTLRVHARQSFHSKQSAVSDARYRQPLHSAVRQVYHASATCQVCALPPPRRSRSASSPGCFPTVKHPSAYHFPLGEPLC